MPGWRAKVCGLIVAVLLMAAVPVSVSASDGERAPSWVAIVSQWVERVVAAVGGGPPEDPGPPPEVPPVPPEHSNSGGNGGESGPEIDPNG